MLELTCRLCVMFKSIVTFFGTRVVLLFDYIAVDFIHNFFFVTIIVQR